MDLAELIDRHAIHQVLLRYARGLDRLDNALVRGCYWDDAIEDHGHFVGTPGDFVPWADRTTLLFETTQHAILNHVCDLQGDEAFCETYYHFSGVTAQGPNFMSTGRYVDRFAKRAGEWRIADRVTIVEGTYDIPKAALAPPPGSAYTPEEPCQASRDRTDVSYHRPPVPRRPR
ncbi:nuclear transport factor 2 family protein [Novosphingobium resinovorum]|uniref:nuclear transport factor 2 family protein n=1 Tax=Novosphingobium TaxID=165696 RepID=UPI001B3C688E|nr:MULTISPECIES: nuclear transport factor 2 family protein [Novosphingobium]MBF7010122.1 nuclear transport factor 2 family protein [Novosphingobium sp. HR1a]WJM28141.1 nuclear transport factor 2 family protein [Novosphingobium resinovorum]